MFQAFALVSITMGCDAPETQNSFQLIELEELVNMERVKVGLPALKSDSRLGLAAQAHADDMHRRDYFDHTSPDGETLRDRLGQGFSGNKWVQNFSD